MAEFISALLGGFLALIGSVLGVSLQKDKEDKENKEHIYIQLQKYFDKLVRFKNSNIDTLNSNLNYTHKLDKIDFTLVKTKKDQESLDLQELRILRKNYNSFLNFITKHKFSKDQSQTKKDVYESEILDPIKDLFEKGNTSIKISDKQANNIFDFIRHFRDFDTIYIKEQVFIEIKLVKNMIDNQQNLHVLNKEEYEMFVWLQNMIDSIVINTSQITYHDTFKKYINAMDENYFILCLILDELSILLNKRDAE